MTLARLRESRKRSADVETRNLGGMWSSMGGAMSLQDPSAIPPAGWPLMQRAGIQLTPHVLLMCDVVFTALRIISTNIVKMGPLRAYKEQLSDDNIPYRVWQGKQPQLLSEPFTPQSSAPTSTGFQRLIWSMGLFGEAWLLKVIRDDLQYVEMTEILHPLFLEVKTDKVTGDPIYIYGSGQSKVELDPEDVIHIPFLSVPAARRALAPIEYVGVASALALAAYEFGSSWFSQGASPDFILTTDAKLGQEEVQRIAQKFLIDHGGLNQAHLPLVLDRGLKAEKVMSSPDESQYTTTLEYARSVIASWFGVPESLIYNGLVRPAPPAPGALEDQNRQFLTSCLAGYITPIEEAFSRLLPKGINAAWDDTRLSQPNATALAAEIMALRQTQSASVNDIRTRKLHWPPVPGGDDVLAPLASNTAPSQTDAQDDKKPDAPPAPAKTPAAKAPPAKASPKK